MEDCFSSPDNSKMRDSNETGSDDRLSISPDSRVEVDSTIKCEPASEVASPNCDAGAQSTSDASSVNPSPAQPASMPPLPSPTVTGEPYYYPYSERFLPNLSLPLSSADYHSTWWQRGAKGVKVVLENENLWNTLNEEGTEMVVAKVGRRMFPEVKIQVSGLLPDSYYFLMLDMIRVDEMKYRFSGNKWHQGLPSREPHSPSIHVHRNSPCLGRHWMDEPVVFENVRLTNDNMCRNGEIMLNSLHKYVVRVHIIPGSDIVQLYHKPALSFTLKQTTFIAVTTYQNERLKKLKMESNPFARRNHRKGNDSIKIEESSPSKENSPDSSQSIKSRHTSPEIQNLVAMAERLPPVTPIHEQLLDPAVRLKYSTPLSIITDFDSSSRNANNGRHYVYERYRPYPSTSRCTIPMCSSWPANPWPYDPYALQWYYYNMLPPPPCPCCPDSTMRPEQQSHVTSSGL